MEVVGGGFVLFFSKAAAFGSCRTAGLVGALVIVAACLMEDLLLACTVCLILEYFNCLLVVAVVATAIGCCFAMTLRWVRFFNRVRLWFPSVGRLRVDWRV